MKKDLKTLNKSVAMAIAAAMTATSAPTPLLASDFTDGGDFVSESPAAEADTTAEKDNDTSKIVAGLGIFYIVKRICAIAVVVIIAFILYKKRHRIASALRNFQKGGDKE